MIGARKIRSWKALALFTAILTLILLLLPQPANHHAAVVFLLVPIFLFGLLDTLAPQQPADQTKIFPHHPPTRPTLFQRPPPTLA
jgi:hypothetical protein